MSDTLKENCTVYAPYNRHASAVRRQYILEQFYHHPRPTLQEVADRLVTSRQYVQQVEKALGLRRGRWRGPFNKTILADEERWVVELLSLREYKALIGRSVKWYSKDWLERRNVKFNRCSLRRRAKSHTILRMRQRGFSFREIEKAVGVHIWQASLLAKTRQKELDSRAK